MAEELADLVTEAGTIDVTCEFCKTTRRSPRPARVTDTAIDAAFLAYSTMATIGEFIMRVLAVPASSALVLSARTADSPPPPQLMTPSVAEGALPLNARRLEIIENWKMPIEPPYIGHLRQPYPGNLVSQWATRTLVPAGGSGELILDITRAAVTKVKLPRQVGLTNALTDQQDAEIKVEFEAQLMWLQPVGGSQAMIKLAHRTLSQSPNRPRRMTCSARSMNVERRPRRAGPSGPP